MLLETRYSSNQAKFKCLPAPPNDEVRPNPSFSTPQEVTDGSSESRPLHKLGNPQTVPAAYASDFAVMMPGHQLPTYIAQPAPLPCPRENIYWPNHEQNLVFP
ncbi:hypothetical protein D5086_009538 [Populus alba]|uniref:Uncharacterized protein n=1 Tax=Populus alba TaxID=43335 RepID=A0ACC4CJM5_POPAL